MNVTSVGPTGILSLMDSYSDMTELERSTIYLALTGQLSFVSCSDIELSGLTVFLTGLSHHVIYPNELLELVDEIEAHLNYVDSASPAERW